MNRRIGITGSPGTGKKSVGRIIAERLNYDFLDLNDLAIRGNAVIGRDEREFIVDPKKLRRLALKAIDKKDVVIVGHLLPSVFKKDEIDFIVVLRCSPWELMNRYVSRGYSEKKAKENVGAEILDVCLVEALKVFGKRKVYEIDTTGKTPEEVAEKIISLYNGEVKKEPIGIDWLTKVVEAGDLHKFFP
ncbi:MAG: adenylate kinase family protein [Nitrososphaerota archaeon]|nr:adenylate kinase family protein [Nitrososphaerales archaeon]MDW8044990.1 adenylate kinase family protein [Nitrososphaerota archaeon]